MKNNEKRRKTSKIKESVVTPEKLDIEEYPLKCYVYVTFEMGACLKALMLFVFLIICFYL